MDKMDDVCVFTNMQVQSSDDRRDSLGGTLTKRKKRSKSISASIHEESEILHQLMHRRLNNVDMKCFKTEVRGLKDIDNFVEQSIILLDVHENTLEMIVSRLLTAMLEGKDTRVTAHEVKQLIFANDERTMMSECLQGM